MLAAFSAGRIVDHGGYFLSLAWKYKVNIIRANLNLIYSLLNES